MSTNSTTPEFKYEQKRWSTTRSKNVAKIAETWRANPTLVRIFHDPKFGQMQMAMLRKDQFEALLKIVNDIRQVRPSPLSAEEKQALND